MGSSLTTNERVGMFLGRVGALFLDGWMVMLAFGVAHASSVSVPTFGYWQCVFFGWLIATLAGTGSNPIATRVRKLVK